MKCSFPPVLCAIKYSDRLIVFFVLLKRDEGLEYRLSSFFVSDEHLLKVGLFFAGPPNFQY